MIADVAGLFGLVIGSFLNVVIHRVPLRRSVVWPSSECPFCGAHVKAFDNLPMLSYLILRGSRNSSGGGGESTDQVSRNPGGAGGGGRSTGSITPAAVLLAAAPVGVAMGTSLTSAGACRCRRDLRLMLYET